jgi:hypothetical protein
MLDWHRLPSQSTQFGLAAGETSSGLAESKLPETEQVRELPAETVLCARRPGSADGAWCHQTRVKRRLPRLQELFRPASVRQRDLPVSTSIPSIP